MVLLHIELSLSVILFALFEVIGSRFGGYPSTINCTWDFIQQPLSHFERGVAEKTFKQRLCIYRGFLKEGNTPQPIFLYTGNESPVEEYVNNTGLMWNLAEKYSALVIFAEHRYFGESIPEIESVTNCISYLSATEAIADYAALCNRLRKNGYSDSPIIAFGGSYGGMLASWLRILHPSAVDGAIAASAPVWGFPLIDSCPLDGSAQVVTYAASAAAGAAPLCGTNLKAAYVLLTAIGATQAGRDLLSESLHLCSSLNSPGDVADFLTYLQDPLFDLSEGSYPFPSNYITYALTNSLAKLPAWAMQVLCESLRPDFGVSISGQPEAVQFEVHIGQVSVSVDWDVATTSGTYSESEWVQSKALELVAAAVQGVQVWYNVSGSEGSCVNWNGEARLMTSSRQRASIRNILKQSSIEQKLPSTDTKECTATKSAVDPGTAWNLLTCNDGLNLVNWVAQGVGNDLYWPPNQPRGFSKLTVVPSSLAYCGYYRQVGLYGVPTIRDDWAFAIDTQYGGTRMVKSASNIVFSNGNLDPWSPAGVLESYLKSPTSTDNDLQKRGLKVKSLNGAAASLLSILIDMGGHHLDLFWETDSDPASVRAARQLEDEQIGHWIEQAIA